MWVISFFFEVLFFLIAGYFALYVLLEFKILLVSRRVERRKLTALGESADLSEGPIFNGERVIADLQRVVGRRAPDRCGL